jgi:sugar O-acyltransferase (sialic acid O-acetyltransferase NeuD family)
MNKIAIFGAGGFGREVKWLIDCVNQVKPTWEFIGYYDDELSPRPSIDISLMVGTISDLNKVSDKLAVVIAIGKPSIKEKIYNQLSNINLYFPTLIHPTVLIGNKVQIGQGCIICAYNILTCNIQIQNFVILNLACTVGHDSIIKNFTSIMPSVNVSGEVIIEDNVYIGTGAKVINQLSIQKNSTIGAGAVVVSNIPSNSTAVGVPAKVIKSF